ncbi:MAG: glycosyltransferase family 9 protein [Thermoguttaceae bacterium]|jgi:lipopolysaccharide heptosyltransferase I
MNQMKSPRILIVRLSAIGDVIHTMPVACALRERFPECRLTWVAEERAGEVLQHHAALDDLILLRHGWLKRPLTVWRLRRRLRAIRPEIAIDAQGLTRSAIVAWLSGAGRRIAPGGIFARELSPWLNTELVAADDLHAVDRGLKLLVPLGIESPAVRFQVPDPPAERAAAEAILGAAGLGAGFILIVPAAGWPSKLWPAERYAAVAAQAGRRLRLPSLVMWGNAEEQSRARHIVAGAEGFARLAPPVTLLELAALARRATFCLGSDTGPLHLAAAVGTRCIGLYGPWPAEKHGPYGPGHITVQKMVFQGSTRQRRHAPPIYMEAIDVASVLAACQRVAAEKGVKIESPLPPGEG